MGHFRDDSERTELETLLLQIKPREILYEKEGPHALCSPQTLLMVHSSFASPSQVRASLTLLSFLRPPTVKIKRSLEQPTLTRRKPEEQFWNGSTTVTNLTSGNYFREGGEECWPPALQRLVKETHDGVEGSELGLSALGAVVSYLKELYLDKQVLAQGRIRDYSGTTFDSPYLVLDSKTIKNLELFENTVDGKVVIPVFHTPGVRFS